MDHVEDRTAGTADELVVGNLDDRMVGADPTAGFPHPRDRPLVVGIAGGSGSGKTTVVTAILDAIGPDRAAVVAHDAYYHDLSNLPMAQRRATNLDHPNAFDDDLFVAHLAALRAGRGVEVPTYDYATYRRLSRTRRLEPRPIVLVEGILLFESARLRDLLDVKVFVDTEPDIRLLRRIQRDMQERDRTLASVLAQYQATVRPMHLEFVEPSKRWADVLIPRGGSNTIAIDMVVRALRESLA